jgi:hypothetical protein
MSLLCLSGAALILLSPDYVGAHHALNFLVRESGLVEPASLWLKVAALAASIAMFFLYLSNVRLPLWLGFTVCVLMSCFGFWVSLHYSLVGLLLFFLSISQIRVLAGEA